MNINYFVKSLKKFDYEVSCNDHTWRIIFPNRKKWEYLIINKYEDTFYLHALISKIQILEVSKDKIKINSDWGVKRYSDEESIKIWNEIIIQANKWLEVVKKDWVKANKFVWKNYPLKYREGIVSHSIVRQYFSDIYRIDKALGSKKMKQFLNLVDITYPKNKKVFLNKMTANDFFNYCKIAYIAGKRKHESVDKRLSGREMYKRYADGRHEGLLDIDGDSEDEFSLWLDGKHKKYSRGGGHPWEIKRGGNTTHIDLYVTRERFKDNEFVVTLNARSIGRLEETLYMFLAITEAGLPISISDQEGLRKRLLAQDNIGIVPAYSSLHRANQSYSEEQDVYDVLHYDDLGKSKRQIAPFISWNPLPIFKPSN